MPPIFVAVVGLGIAIWFNPIRSKRIIAWLNPDETKSDIGYQAYQSMLALGAGGWTGVGLGDGRQKLGFVPEHHTDFILSVIGEELGLVATLAVLVAFIILVICGIYIAWNARDTFGLLLASGLSLLIGLQAFVNIGVVTSALPNKGLPLPFISYGGSNLVMMLAGVGLLLSVARRAHEGVTLPIESARRNRARPCSPSITGRPSAFGTSRGPAPPGRSLGADHSDQVGPRLGAGRKPASGLARALKRPRSWRALALVSALHHCTAGAS